MLIPHLWAQTIWHRAQRDVLVRQTRRETRWRWAGVAAVVLLIVASGMAIYRTQFSPEEEVVVANPGSRVTKRTLAGQRSDFALPDGSHVWLNAESTLQLEDISFGKNFSHQLHDDTVNLIF